MKQVVIITIFTLLFVSAISENVDALSQTVEEIMVDIKPGETQTFRWGLASDKENQITTVEMSAEGEGSEFLSFEKSIELEDPEQIVYTTITVSIPEDYPGGIELKPKLFATDLDGVTIGNMMFEIAMEKTVNLNIGLNDNPNLWVDWEAVKKMQMDESITNQTESVESEQDDLAQMPGGCLIATATYGSELAPQVQLLREIRDNTVLKTQSGTYFMTGFNQLYYSFSPTIADWERQYPAFKELVKLTITPLLTSLSILNSVNVDSEEEMLGYGIGIILLNVAMYFVAPTVLIIKLRKQFNQNLLPHLPQ